VVPDRHGAAQAQGRHRDRRRSADRGKKGLIELAYRVAEATGVQAWCQDEAGPYQAIPQPGLSWQRTGKPLRQPHEYVRGGTAKLLTLFRPATGEVRARGVTSAPNVGALGGYLGGYLRRVGASIRTPTLTQRFLLRRARGPMTGSS
jgi:hypothetical protein